MSEDLKKKVSADLTQMIGVKVTKEKHQELLDFCDEREWNMSAFIRRAMDESMTRVVADERSGN